MTAFPVKYEQEVRNMEWTQSLKLTISYIESHLLTEMTIQEIADTVCLSPFYFQKGFRIMTGYSVGEYIRQRRLYLAALESLSGQEKVIDLAYKYGYQTPESFTKAFIRFHGVSPAQLRGNASKIKVFLPLKITVTIQGGNDMDFTVQHMDPVQVIGFEKSFSEDSSYKEIPQFWSAFSEKCTSKSNSSEVQQVIDSCMVGEFGICIDDLNDGKQFRYMIAGTYKGGPVPDGMQLYTLPAGSWAKFRCVGPMPGALQSVNTEIFKNWLPGNPDYEIAQGISVEWYSLGEMSSPDYESEIWIPVKEK